MEQNTYKQKSASSLNNDVRRGKIINLTDEERLKRSYRLWKKLVKELKVLQDNNYTARKIFDYVEKNYV
jgi:hypothetical protein